MERNQRPFARVVRWAGRAVLAAGLGLVPGCEALVEAEPPPEAKDYSLQCDPLSPEYCLFPWPNNAFTVRTSQTETGRRLALSHGALPKSYYDVQSSPTHWNRSDGFSTMGPILTHLPGLTVEGLAQSGAATSVTIEDSIKVDSPTAIIDTETGEWVPHWVELDETTDDTAARVLLIHPAYGLEHNRRYIVAIRNLPGVSVSPAFGALRDRLASDDPTVPPRRGLFAEILDSLRVEGFGPVEDLQLAWDFTTASQADNTQWMLHMRDQALGLVGAAGPQYEVVSVEADPWPDEGHIAQRIYGEMQVPLYLDTTAPGGLLVFDEAGRPTQNPEAPWAKFAFEILIPASASADNPAHLLQYGHGLLGAKEQIESGHFREFCNTYNYAIFGVDFIGMAEDDQLHIGRVISDGRFDDFATVVFRQHQGMLNSLLAMRMMKGGFADDPEFGPLIDAEGAGYLGISQGGIFGGTYMALTTDIERGVLGVMGMPYNVLLSRSVDFDEFFTYLRQTYTDPRDIQMTLALAQQLWDRIEPSGYARHIVSDPLPGTPTHQVLMRGALGDHQVTSVGSHVMARSIGVRHVDTGQPEIFGLEVSNAPYDGSGLVEYGFGLPADPVGNLPQRQCEDPHGNIRRMDEAREQLDLFLRLGIIENFCPGGVCDYPDMSGCDASQD